MGKKARLEIKGEQVLCDGNTKTQGKKKWRKPKLEDVSGKVMAQPYIRFT